MTNKEYLNYLRVIGFDEIDTTKIETINSSKIEVQGLCEEMRKKGVGIDKALYFLDLLLRMSGEDGFKFIKDNILLKRIRYEKDLHKYINDMSITLESMKMG